jgi:hypothetical protein
MKMAEVRYCKKHPRVETNLRCGKCDELICPDCMVHTPVGVRCGDCAQVRRVPTYDVSTQFIARGIAAGASLGVAFGVLFVAIFRFFLPALPIFVSITFFRILAIVVFLGMGYAIGAGVSIAVNRKRGKSLKLVAAGSVLTAYLIMSMFNVIDLSTLGLIGTAAAFYLAINRF